MSMTLLEAMDYVKAIDLDGITLTENGRGAAVIILERRKTWTSTHALMLQRIMDGMERLPFRLEKMVARTRLGDAIAIARDYTRDYLRKQKSKMRRKAAKNRRLMMEREAA